MAQGAVYTPTNQLVTFNGVPLIFSRAEGTYSTLTWVKPEKVAMVVGVDGAGYYNVSKNNAAFIDVVVLVNGIENDVLDAAYKAFIAAPNGLLFPVSVVQGLTLYVGLGVCVGPPPVTMSDSTMTNSWRIASLSMVGKTGSKVGAPLP
jgi:hypothetical protein